MHDLAELLLVQPAAATAAHGLEALLDQPHNIVPAIVVVALLVEKGKQREGTEREREREREREKRLSTC